MGFLVRSPGLLASVQGSGRPGFLRSGIAEGGALDLKSLAIANLLAGNAPGEAGLEMTLAGAELEFTLGNVVAIAGADMEPRLNGEAAPMYRSFAVQPGDVLAFGPARSGCRAYLAFAGGLELPLVMGSKSTNLNCGIGGYRGRGLKAGDFLRFAAPLAPLRIAVRRVEGRRIAPAEGFGSPVAVLRVIPGPQAESFTEAGLEAFYGGEYAVTARSDRMGSVLEGPAVGAKGPTDIVSDGIPLGGVQVPSGGQPIAMLADRQTTGGYAKIAVVIDADLGTLAQRRPGDRVAFSRVSLGVAQRASRREAAALAALARRLGS
jgi:antagonist of KipI